MTKHGPNCKLKICVCQPVVDQVTKHQTNLRWFAWILRTSPQTTESISFTQTTEQFLLFCLFHHENQLKIPFKPLRWRYARMGTKGLHTRTWKRFFNRKEKRRDFFSIWWHLELRFQRSQTAPIFGVSKTDRLFWRGGEQVLLGEGNTCQVDQPWWHLPCLKHPIMICFFHMIFGSFELKRKVFQNVNVNDWKNISEPSIRLYVSQGFSRHVETPSFHFHRQQIAEQNGLDHAKTLVSVWILWRFVFMGPGWKSLCDDIIFPTNKNQR